LPPPVKQKSLIMCLGLIPNHFLLIFLKDGCPLLPSSTECHNHKNEEAVTWEDGYLDQHDLFRDIMIIEKGEKPSQPKKESNKAKPILCDTPEKQSNNLKLLRKMKKILFHLIFPNHLVINE